MLEFFKAGEQPDNFKFTSTNTGVIGKNEYAWRSKQTADDSHAPGWYLIKYASEVLRNEFKSIVKMIDVAIMSFGDVQFISNSSIVKMIDVAIMSFGDVQFISNSIDVGFELSDDDKKVLPVILCNVGGEVFSAYVLEIIGTHRQLYVVDVNGESSEQFIMVSNIADTISKIYLLSAIEQIKFIKEFK